MKPHRILVGGAARIGRDPPARLDLGPRRRARTRGWYCRHRWRAAWPRPSLARGASQLDVAGANHLDRSVGAAKAQGAVRLEPVECPGNPVVGAGVDDKRAPERMGASEPGLRDQGRSASPPHAPAAARSSPRAAAQRPAADIAPPSAALGRSGSSGAAARLTPNPTTMRSPLRSSRIPASFLPSNITSLGHFSRSGGRARRRRWLR